MNSAVQDPFSLWNARLLEHFFSAASKDSEVWLQIDPDELDDIGRDLGGDEGFLSAVCEGPSWSTFRRNDVSTRGTSHDLVKRVEGLVGQRKSPLRQPINYINPEKISPAYLGKRAPTYLPYLVALVRSVLLGQDGFYNHLRISIDLPDTWSSSQMDRLSCAWQDLQAWTKENSGEFGYFKLRILGGYTLIGVPKSQSIMTKKDCDAMGKVFAQMSLSPHQSLNSALLSQIKTASSEATFLSASFKDALRSPEFDEPINIRIKSLFEDWNGEAPSSKASGKSGNGQYGEDRLYLEFCLNLQEGNQYPWIINFRVPPVVEDGDLELKVKDKFWLARIRGTEPVTTNVQPTEDFQLTARHVLDESREQPVKVEIFRFAGSEPKSKIRDAYFAKLKIRILVWTFDDVTQKHELRERPLPQVGIANLLICSQRAQHIKNEFRKTEVKFQDLQVDGLPDGWLLICITECERLSAAQKMMIVDGKSERIQQRAFRLLGGRPIRRAGLQQYLSYDLPLLELNAKAGTTVHAEGLNFIEEDKVENLNFQSSIRRFRINPIRQGASLYTIRAICDGSVINTQTLRIAPESGERVEMGKQFSLGTLGETRFDGLGLRGVLPENFSSQNQNETYFDLEFSDLGEELDTKYLEQIRRHPLAKFLDSLAQLGSQSYGSSRDQIIRLTPNYSNASYTANMLLSDLRSKGHIEFETNVKGYTTRVYSVSPAFVRLRILANGQSVFGLIGTLRLKQWDFVEYAGDGFRLFQPASLHGYMPSIRIAVEDLGLFKELAEMHGFGVLDSPSHAIAAWAGAKEQVVQQINSIASESVGDRFLFLERFNPNTGYYFPAEEMRCPSNGPTYQLFRMEDRDITRLLVHTIGLCDGGSLAQRFGFVRDSRWGVWIALGALADFAKTEHGIQDASPWPITYLEDSGTLLLPAQISFPSALERALNLCTGHGPIQLDLEKGTSQSSDLISITHKAAGTEICKVSVVYGSMATGPWLAYEHVPQEIASLVVSKVGAKLVPWSSKFS
jgi:hypothetical protein